jgi:acyl-coenzyme A synthetase/AMP-(fatty) acid ligase
LNEPGLTAARFIRNPFGGVGDPLDRIYLTGDIGRLTAERGVEFSGRSDNQVKIRGFRVELEEVEMALRQCPGVIDAAAAIDSNRADPLLHAFVRVQPGFDAGQCRKNILSTLPQYMVPTSIVEVGEFPLTPNGKLDRGRLLSLARAQAK